ncbi:hypothetical protein QBC35DRAFT_234478 [Podospora australis]|uniref:Serine protease n=1 Tax=Podospora australis TaxID=1536484 RepID=A0AAN6WVP7_9PEZI|nr:hypothetical protein QBC35DRAFT_234478 [Podospora australis]
MSFPYVGVAGTWDLSFHTQGTPETFFTTEGTSESVFDPDHRSLVDDNDIRDGGKYRSIVKLQMRYEGQDGNPNAYAMGTGWLISPDTLVTAGHNVYDWSGFGTGLGRAVDIKAYIGYHGRESLKSPIVQSRSGKIVVTTAEWIMSKENRHRDVAFIRLDRPFEGNLRLFSYKATPETGDDMIGVVGYPADKSLVDEDGRDEKGAQMWEQFNSTTYVLDSAKNQGKGMLKYRISTFGGQSGAPVIRKSMKQVVIGTHVYGGGDKNSASVIGPNGNDYDGLLKVFTQKFPVVGKFKGIDLVRYGISIESGAGATPGAPPPPKFAENSEGFFDDLKDVGKFIRGHVGPAVPWFLQQAQVLGGPLSAVAHGVLNAAGVARAESSFSTTPSTKGYAERAILAEAALQTVLRLDGNEQITHRMIGEMKNYYAGYGIINYDPIVCKLGPAITESANTILKTTNYVQKNSSQRRTLAPVAFPGNPYQTESYGSSIAGNGLVAALSGPTKPVEAVEPEIWGLLGDIIKVGYEFSPLKGVAHLVNNITQPESAAAASLPEADRKGLELLAKRALLGEAALQAVSKLSKQDIELVTLATENETDYSPEFSFGDFFKTVVQTVAPVITQVMPPVVGPLLQVATGDLGAESSGLLGVPPANGLRRKTSSSILDALHDGTLSNGLLQIVVIIMQISLLGLAAWTSFPRKQQVTSQGEGDTPDI